MPSGADRQRRYRRHLRGDHTLCDPDRRCDARDPEPPATPQQRADGRGPRGQQLWDDMAGAELGPAHRVLLEEACRIADRLDRLDAILDGRDDWLRLRVAEGGEDVRISVDGVLSEARQHASTLRGLVSELRAAQPKTPAKTPPIDQPKGGLGDLNAKLAARRRSAPGGAASS